MTQPTQAQPNQPDFQPPEQQPEQLPPQPVPPPKKKSRTLLVGIIAGVLGLGIGGAVGASGDGTTTAGPGATVTATATATATETVTEGSEPTELPTDEPTEKPVGWNPKPKDFKVTIKVTDKQCFGSAGCNVSYKVGLDYLGSQSLPDEGTTDITYKISGAEDPIIGTLTLDSEGKFDASEESTSTRSSSSKLTAKVTEVDYNEFG
jgi:hypothetical protein